MSSKNIFEKSKNGLEGFDIPTSGFNIKYEIPRKVRRKKLNLPAVSKVDVMRHYQEMSRMNYGVDDGFYPLGSCTMKYNPRINEKLASLPSFNIHPLSTDDYSQGALEIIYKLKNELLKITGLKGATLQPAAGAHGELTGLMLVKAYHEDNKSMRTKVLIPDSAHGTNPATAAICGYTTVSVASDENGCIDLNDLKSKLDNTTAAIMMTVPNTLGIFDNNIVKIVDLVHKSGALVYMDGANMNALVGKISPAKIGIDVMHLNLHKTFSTPHGGGGPGAGAVCVNERLIDYLPLPDVDFKDNKYFLNNKKSDKSIGKVISFYGNFGVLVRAYSYIKSLGLKGLKKVSEVATLNANYMFSSLKNEFHSPFDTLCMHEFVITDKKMGNHITTLDVAKRLLDFGYHPPTIYFPLIVKGAMMIEPTETESKENMDMFISTLLKIKEEANVNPEVVKNAPHKTFVRRLDEVGAARKPVLNYQMELESKS